MLLVHFFFFPARHILDCLCSPQHSGWNPAGSASVDQSTPTNRVRNKRERVGEEHRGKEKDRDIEIGLDQTGREPNDMGFKDQ